MTTENWSNDTAREKSKYLQENLCHCQILHHNYRGADKSLARPTSRCFLFDGENISFEASLVIYINSTNIHSNYDNE